MAVAALHQKGNTCLKLKASKQMNNTQAWKPLPATSDIENREAQFSSHESNEDSVITPASGGLIKS
jgi:hypothetical protein